MQQICIPGTALASSRIGFGTASLHHAMQSAERQVLLRTALDSGFTHFDTARMYGEGMAERTLGVFLAGGLRQQVTIATKFGIPAKSLFERMPALMYGQRFIGRLVRRFPTAGEVARNRILTPTAAEMSLAKSLEALQTDWIDLLLVHEPQVEEIELLYDLGEWLVHQKSSGRVRYLGLAGNAVSCVPIAEQMRGVFDILQVEDSLVKREADAIVQAGRPLQITYGYLRLAHQQLAQSGARIMDGLAIIKGALARNPNGLVLVSTRKPQRISDIARLAELEVKG